MRYYYKADNRQKTTEANFFKGVKNQRSSWRKVRDGHNALGERTIV